MYATTVLKYFGVRGHADSQLYGTAQPLLLGSLRHLPFAIYFENSFPVSNCLRCRLKSVSVANSLISSCYVIILWGYRYVGIGELIPFQFRFFELGVVTAVNVKINKYEGNRCHRALDSAAGLFRWSAGFGEKCCGRKCSGYFYTGMNI